jgi:hypothetical protein
MAVGGWEESNFSEAAAIFNHHDLSKLRSETLTAGYSNDHEETHMLRIRRLQHPHDLVLAEHRRAGNGNRPAGKPRLRESRTMNAHPLMGPDALSMLGAKSPSCCRVFTHSDPLAGRLNVPDAPVVSPRN